MPDVMIAPPQGQVRHQVVVVHETVVGQSIGVAEIAIAGPRRTVAIDGADRKTLGQQAMGDQRGHGPAETVARDQDRQFAVQGRQQDADRGINGFGRMGKTEMDQAGEDVVADQGRLDVGQGVADRYGAAKGDDRHVPLRGDKSMEFARTERCGSNRPGQASPANRPARRRLPGCNGHR